MAALLEGDDHGAYRVAALLKAMITARIGWQQPLEAMRAARTRYQQPLEAMITARTPCST